MRRDEATVAKAAVAGGDRGRADTQFCRKRADRRQPFTRPELGRGNQRLDADGDGCRA
jgi:hypothetical protein